MRRKLAGIFAALGIAAAGLVVGGGVAHADGYGCTGELIFTANPDSHIQVRVYKGADHYLCAVTIHTGSGWGTYYGTGVRLTNETSGVTRASWGNYAYYAGPNNVQMSTGSSKPYTVIGSDDHVEVAYPIYVTDF